MAIDLVWRSLLCLVQSKSRRLKGRGAAPKRAARMG